MSRPHSLEPSESLEKLIAQIAGGSEEAVWELLHRYSKNILRVARRHLPSAIRSKFDSEDVVQSVWKSLIERPSCLADFRDTGRLVAYLEGMARLKATEKYRRFTKTQAHSVRRETPLRPPVKNCGPSCTDPTTDHRARTPSSLASSREHWTLAYEKEGARGQEVIRLRLLGLTQDQVAEQLGISKSTVRRILHSMLQSLGT